MRLDYNSVRPRPETHSNNLTPNFVKFLLIGTLKLAGCGGGGTASEHQQKTGPDDFLYCADLVAEDLRKELASRRQNVKAYCELFVLDYLDRIESCLDEFGPYIHVCRNVEPATKRELSYEETVETCRMNVTAERNEFANLAAECTAYHIEDE